MYAVQDVGMAVTPLPIAGVNGPQPGQVEPREVESTEKGSLESEGRNDTIYKPGSPVVQLVQASAQGYAELVEQADRISEANNMAGAYFGERVGREVDVYA